MINARAETLAEKPAFRAALHAPPLPDSRRRILRVAGRAGRQGGRQKSGRELPMHFHRKDNGLFAFAGLWEEWRAPDGSPLHSCTIITTDAQRRRLPPSTTGCPSSSDRKTKNFGSTIPSPNHPTFSACWPPTPPRRWKPTPSRARSMRRLWTTRRVLRLPPRLNKRGMHVS